MVRSRSRSPRWKHRSISPTYGRSQEYHVERPLHQSYSGELREFGQSSGRPVQWRSQREKWTETVSVESRSGEAQYGAVHHKVFEYGHPSPNARRVESEYTTTTGRNFYLQEREGNQTYPLPSRFLEDNPYNDHDERPSDSSEWHDQRHHSHNERHHEHDQWHNDLDDRHYHQNVEIPTCGRLYNEKPKSFGGDPQIDSYEEPVITTYGSPEKWHDSEGFRSHGLHEERHSGSSRSPGRRAEEFLDRSSYQKRYPEEDEVRGYREATGRGWVPGKHEVIEHERDLKWRGEKFPHNRKSYPNASHSESESMRVKDIPRERYSNSDRYEEYVQVKSGFAHSQKYPEMQSSSEHHQIFSSGKQQGYSSKDKEFTTSSSSNKEVSRFHSNSRKSGTDVNRTEGRHSGSAKYSVPEHYSSRFRHVNKKEVSPRSTTSVTRGRAERGKEFRNRPEFSKDRRDDTHKRSSHRSCHVETSRHGTNNERDRTTESLTIKLDMKKSVNKCRPTSSHASERLMSRDLVSVGKKRDEFHHVFEHMGSSFKANPNISSGEFAQEIITLVHQIKEDHFKSSDLTLHDRFTKLQNVQSPEREEEKDLGPEIHRRIDMSLADLHSRERKPVGRKTSTWVAVNPDDLRHDIERRRKERLQDKYEKPHQTVEPRFLSHRSERPEKSRSLSRVKAARNPRFKEPSFGLMEHQEKLRRETTARKAIASTKRKIGETLEPRRFQRSIKHFVKEYSSSGRKRGLTLESKYRRIYGVGFGRTNHRIFTKHLREGMARKRRAERELPSSTTDK
ncbi:BCLAF1 and THRAP3 family member 3-like isoform X2 [Carcharodon carcharias]|uniref:BCLAF1 and THRAP3 family member 3-like isoform X2 n=1 Tax=Carcharodon carcharias TaxID=13397 RepID=UPI001B7EDD51|nr:BCLAF1 and THRAP3 family member 3-like isoform X2 [Carcharodon carcharias]